MVVLLAVTALLGWLAFTGGDDDDPGDVLQPGAAAGPEGFADEAPDTRIAPEVLRADTDGPEGETPSPAAADLYAPETGSLLVRVRWADGSPAAGVPFVVAEMGRPDPGRFPRIRTTDEQGEKHLEDIARGTVAVFLTELDAQQTVVVEPGAQALVELVAERGTPIRGVVLDEREVPAEGAGIWISAAGSGLDGRIAAVSDASGRFELEARLEHRRVGARMAGYQPSLLQGLEAWDGTDIVLVLRDGGAALEGRVLDPEGEGIADADVRVGGSLGWFQPRLPAGRESPPPMWTRTDEHGRFAFEGVPSGWTQVAAWATRFTVSEDAVHLSAGETAEHDLMLQPESVVTGRVTDEAGLPIENAGVMTTEPDWEMKQRATTRGDGRYVLRGLPAGVVALEARRRDHRPAMTRVTVAPGVETTWNVVLPSGDAVAGVVIDKHTSAGLPGWNVLAEGADGPAGFVRTDSQGRFRLSGLASGPWRVTAFAPDSSGVVGAEALDVQPGDETLRLVVDTSAKADAGLRGRVSLPGGGELPPRTCWVILEALDGGGRERMEGLDPSGEFQFEPLLPGRYRLTVHVPGHSSPDLGEIVLVSGVVTDLGTLRLEAGGTVLAFVDYLDGVAASDLRIQLLSVSPGAARMEPVGGPTVFRSTPVAAGPWDVVAWGPGIARRSWPVEVRSGEESEVRIAVEPGIRLHVTLTWLDEDRVRPGTVLSVIDDREVVVATKDFNSILQRTETYETWLAPGAYRVEVARKHLPDVVREIELSEPQGVELHMDMEAPEG